MPAADHLEALCRQAAGAGGDHQPSADLRQVLSILDILLERRSEWPVPQDAVAALEAAADRQMAALPLAEQLELQPLASRLSQELGSSIAQRVGVGGYVD